MKYMLLSLCFLLTGCYISNDPPPPRTVYVEPVRYYYRTPRIYEVCGYQYVSHHRSYYRCWSEYR
jgi:hypothetical protein